jgi:cystathionine beta-lyase
MAIKALTAPGDNNLIHTPLYPPIANTININRRNVVDNTLVYCNGGYEIDMVDFEEKIINNNVKMFILCSPHNPVGRVWTRDELQNMGRICAKHNVLVVSDEIHCDIVFPGHKHLVFSTVCEDVPVIICTAPSKTFNIAGLQVSNIFIEDEKLRDAFKKEILSTGYHQLNAMGLAAGQAAYQHGHTWLENLLEYLQENAHYVKNFVAANLPQVKVADLQGTYLMWLDFNELNFSHEQLEDIITNKCKLWPSSGAAFGEKGRGFFRFNIGCTKSTIEEAMERLLILNNL